MVIDPTSEKGAGVFAADYSVQTQLPRSSVARQFEGVAFINIGPNAQNGLAWTPAWHLDR